MSALHTSDPLLRQSDELFRRLFEDSPIGIAIMHPETYRVHKANRALCEMLGYNETDLVERSFIDITHPDDLVAESALVEQMLQNKISTYSLEKRFIQKDGGICWGNLSASIIRDPNGNILYGLGMVENITERKRVETAREIADNARRESEERFFKAFQSNPIASAITSFPSGRLLDANDAYLELLGYTREHSIGQTTIELNFWQDLRVRQALMRRLQHQTAVRDIEIAYRTQDGKIRYGIIFLERIEISGCPCLLKMLYDITDRKQTEIALQQQAAQEQLLRSITQRIRQSLDLDAILDSAVEEVGKTLHADRALIFRLRLDGGSVVLKETVLPPYPASANMGWEEEWFPADCHAYYLQGNPRIVPDVETDSWGSCLVEFMQAMQVRSKIVAPIIERWEGGSSRVWGLLIVHSCAYQRQWQPAEADFLQQIANQLAIALQQADLYQRAQQELFDRKQIESQLLTSLQEKEVLLKEIHHRVKNNLQIISSLLRMQARQNADEQTAILFQEAQNRVQSMALIHEQLYQSPDLAQIDFGEYLNTLVSHLFHSYGIHHQISLTIDTNGLYLNLDNAIPCGLIINELVSNSLKYAFPNGQSGKIQIHFQAQADPTEPAIRQGMLTVEDDGVGISDQIDWQTTRSLGLRIVRNLVVQLGGHLTLDRAYGSRFRITFPISA